jgi:hypothetical protein
MIKETRLWFGGCSKHLVVSQIRRTKIYNCICGSAGFEAAPVVACQPAVCPIVTQKSRGIWSWCDAITGQNTTHLGVCLQLKRSAVTLRKLGKKSKRSADVRDRLVGGWEMWHNGATVFRSMLLQLLLLLLLLMLI